MAKFRSYIVEFIGETVQDVNIKINVGASSKVNAISMAIKKHNTKNVRQLSEKDLVKTHCSKLKKPSGQILSTYSAR